MRVSRVFRHIIRILLLVLTLSMSLISFLGGYSAVLILSDEGNIVVPDGDISANLNITDTSQMYVEIPMKLNNAGFFDLEDLTVKIEIEMEYSRINETGPGTNATVKETIFDKTVEFDPIKAGEVFKGNFSGEADDFQNIPEPKYIDLTVTVNYTMDINLDLKYSLRLIALHVEIYDVEISGLEGGF